MKTNIQLSKTEAQEWLTTIELTGCIDYWCSILDWNRDSEYWIINAKIKDYETNKEFLINAETINTGIKKILKPDFQIREDLKNAITKNDPDAELIDCIIQAALFDEIIYG